MEQSAFEEILKFGEFSSMLNKSQAMKAKNNDKIETRGKSCTNEHTETTTFKMKDNYGMFENNMYLIILLLIYTFIILWFSY